MRTLADLQARWRTQRAAVDAWERENPDLARDWRDALDEDRRRWDAALIRSERTVALYRAGVPQRVVDVIVDGDVRATPAAVAVRDWLTGGKAFLVLTGGTGAGKSVAACLALESGGIFERAVSAARLGLYGDDDVKRMRSLRRTRVLVLDDLGAEFSGDVWRAQFDELVDERYGARHRTIITTNLSPDAVRERYGARVADRIRHDGTVVACGAESLRAPGGGGR